MPSPERKVIWHGSIGDVEYRVVESDNGYGDPVYAVQSMYDNGEWGGESYGSNVDAPAVAMVAGYVAELSRLPAPDPLGLAARVMVLEAALQEISAASPPNEWEPYDDGAGELAGYDGEPRVAWVDMSNSGDVHDHGRAVGMWYAARTAREALATASPATEAILEGLRAVAEVCEESLERRYIDDWWFNFKEDFPALAAGLKNAQ